MTDTRKTAVRQAFGRAAASYDHHAFLQQEVARRLDDHLDGMKLEPALILDAGCGTGFGADLLHARFPEARVLGADFAQGMVAQAQVRQPPQAGWRTWLARLRRQSGGFSALCADVERLPLRARSLDMIWSSLTLQWLDPVRAFAEWHRVLKPGGLLLFATLGPDTLRELRAASSGIDGHAHVNRFIDMHDLGDALVQAGFEHPVMEMEHLTLTYADLKGVLADLKGIGAHTVLQGGRSGLMGKTAWAALQAGYEAFRQDGRLPATYEVVYGHAWAGQPRREDGRQVIEFRRRPT